MLGIFPLSEQPLSALPSDANSRTGALSKTLDALTLSSANTIALKAAFDKQLGALTLTSDNDLKLVGSFDKTLGTLTLSASADLVISATFNKTLDSVTGASSSDLLIQDTLSKTLDALTLSAASTVALQGVFVKTLASITLDADAEISGGEVEIPEFGGHFGEDDYRKYRKKLKTAAKAAEDFDRKKYIQEAVKIAEIVEHLPTKTTEIIKVAEQVENNQPVRMDFTVIQAELKLAISYIERMIEAHEAILAEEEDEEAFLLLI